MKNQGESTESDELTVMVVCAMTPSHLSSLDFLKRGRCLAAEQLGNSRWTLEPFFIHKMWLLSMGRQFPFTLPPSNITQLCYYYEKSRISF